MRLELAKYQRMSETGSSILRIIQNEELPILDLIVRESIQNSLDAGLSGHRYIDVEFNTGIFEPELLKKEFEGIKESFYDKFKEEKPKYMVIRDKNTTGLTGPIQFEDLDDEGFGNFYKLVYEINKPQNKAGSGGSWGLGKTVFYRAGIGLVIFYSRVYKEHERKYEHRLAACLVEDETKNDSLISIITKKTRRGIAWWGEPSGDWTVPLIEQDRISEILKIFNIEPYLGEDTGTTIIVPFINENRIMSGVTPANNGDCFNNYVWNSSIEDYLRLSIQKWYAPRLSNENYAFGGWLRCSINGVGLRRDNFYPLFGIIQDLYNMTKFGKKQIQQSNDSFTIEDINLRNIFEGDSLAGQIAFIKADRKILMMNPPDNYPNPYHFINTYDSEWEFNPPIITYVRKPGMIVNYEISGAWTDGVIKTTNGEFLIGLFVLNSEKNIKRTEEQMSLDEYMRKSEKADHTSWIDWIGTTKLDIVSKIVKNCASKIKQRYSEKEEIKNFRNIGLGKALADILLPPDNFGNISNFGGGVSTGNSGKGSKNSLVFSVISMEHFKREDSRIVRINFDLTWKRKMNSILLEACIKSEGSDIGPNQWESAEGIGKAFPLEVESLTITKIQPKKKSPPFKPQNMIVSKENLNTEANGFMMGMVKTKNYMRNCGVEFLVLEDTGYVMEGYVDLKIEEDGIIPGISILNNGGVLE